MKTFQIPNVFHSLKADVNVIKRLAELNPQYERQFNELIGAGVSLAEQVKAYAMKENVPYHLAVVAMRKKGLIPSPEKVIKLRDKTGR